MNPVLTCSVGLLGNRADTADLYTGGVVKECLWSEDRIEQTFPSCRGHEWLVSSALRPLLNVTGRFSL